MIYPPYRNVHREKYVLKAQLARAREFGVPATLTFEEWILTLNRFNWKCAYCQRSPYQNMEHFIPIRQGGGTTLDNCIPSCQSCNMAKMEYAPQKRSPLMQERMQRVHLCLLLIAVYT